MVSADTADTADTDPTRRRLGDHLLGPAADLLDLGADAAAALGLTVLAAVVPDRGGRAASVAANPPRPVR